MSSKYNKVKGYYDTGRWNKEMVGNAVVKSWITAGIGVCTGQPS